MSDNYFFNDYGIPSQHKFVGRNEQLKEAGYDESGVENTFGRGWSNDGQYPQGTGTYGGFIDRSGQLSELGLNPEDYELVYGEGYVRKRGKGYRYLTFTAIGEGCSVGFYNGGRWSAAVPDVRFEYSIDGGLTWMEYQISMNSDGVVLIRLADGESVMFRGLNSTLYIIGGGRDIWIVRAQINGKTSASGDVTSLLNRVGGDVAVPDRCYQSMFKDCTGLTTAPALPATTLASSCYNNMFNGCMSLTAAPALPATMLANQCYNNMFNGCTSLTAAPDLPATTLASSCYNNMFNGCTSLTAAPALPATTLAEGCYFSMFSGCTSLTTAPELPATTLVNQCYYAMFQGCTSLTSITCLATDISASDCTTNWVYGVSVSGTFTKVTSMSDWTTGASGIPSEWTIQDYQE